MSLMASPGDETACVWSYGGCQHALWCVDNEDVALRTLVPRTIVAGKVIEYAQTYMETGPPHLIEGATPNPYQQPLVSRQLLRRVEEA